MQFIRSTEKSGKKFVFKTVRINVCEKSNKNSIGVYGVNIWFFEN